MTAGLRALRRLTHSSRALSAALRAQGMKPSREGSARSQAAFEGRCITGICAGGYKSQDWSAKKSYGEIVSDTHESAVTMTIAPTGNINLEPSEKLPLTSKEEFPQPTGDYSDVVATKAAAKVAAAAEAVDKIKMRCDHTHTRARSHTAAGCKSVC